MSGYGYLLNAIDQKSSGMTQPQFTIGRVIDTNDPQQMGRVRAHCPGYGDQEEAVIENIPWAMYVSPLAGVSSMGSRGHEEDLVDGPVAYGMWNIPKIGAYVLVGCVDGDKSMRFYAGCVNAQYMTHTLPHGRYNWTQEGNLEGLPDGPLDTFDQPIYPLYENLENQFTPPASSDYVDGETLALKARENLEWRTRGADSQAAGITNLHVEHPNDGPGTAVADHENYQAAVAQEENGETRTFDVGYSTDQQEPDDTYDYTGGRNLDSLTYSWTTPGFHSISMDDRPDNARIRIRTTSGHQIIMDDTNERIYISASGGESWIEIDNVGNIDIFASKNISTHAGGDINFTTDKTFRVKAKEGIHMYADDDIRLRNEGKNGGDFNIHSNTLIRTRSEGETRFESIGDMHIKSPSTLFLQFDTDIHITSTNGSTLILAGTDIDIFSAGNTFLAQSGTLDINTSGEGKWTTGAEMHHLSGATMFFTGGSDIHLNGPPASGAASADSAQPAVPAQEFWAYWTSRVPEHEPWPRTFMTQEGAEGTDNNGPNNEAGTLTDANTHVLEFPYSDTSVGKDTFRTDNSGKNVYGPYERNDKWHR